MDSRQFHALADLARLKPASKGRLSAFLAMVQGLTQQRAARETGCSQPAVSAAVRRIKEAQRLAKKAAG